MCNKTNILVVDDEEVVRLALSRVLAGDHCQVAAARSGADALDEIKQRAFDVVLLDLRMPGMDGISVLKAIKREWPEIQVIVVTGYPSLDTAKEAIRYGAYDYLAKPVEPDEMIKVTHSAVLQKRWSLQRDRTQQAETPLHAPH